MSSSPSSTISAVRPDTRALSTLPASDHQRQTERKVSNVCSIIFPSIVVGTIATLAVGNVFQIDSNNSLLMGAAATVASSILLRLSQIVLSNFQKKESNPEVQFNNASREEVIPQGNGLASEGAGAASAQTGEDVTPQGNGLASEGAGVASAQTGASSNIDRESQEDSLQKYVNMLGKTVDERDKDEKGFQEEEITSGTLVIVKRSDGSYSWGIVIRIISRRLYVECRVAVYHRSQIGSKKVSSNYLIKPSDLVKSQIESGEDVRSQNPTVAQSEIDNLKREMDY